MVVGLPLVLDVQADLRVLGVHRGVWLRIDTRRFRLRSVEVEGRNRSRIPEIITSQEAVDDRTIEIEADDLPTELQGVLAHTVRTVVLNGPGLLGITLLEEVTAAQDTL